MRMVNHETRKIALESHEPIKVYYQTEEDRKKKSYRWNRTQTYFDYVWGQCIYFWALPPCFARNICLSALQARKIQSLGGLGESLMNSLSAMDGTTSARKASDIAPEYSKHFRGCASSFSS